MRYRNNGMMLWIRAKIKWKLQTFSLFDLHCDLTDTLAEALWNPRTLWLLIILEVMLSNYISLGQSWVVSQFQAIAIEFMTDYNVPKTAMYWRWWMESCFYLCKDLSLGESKNKDCILCGKCYQKSLFKLTVSTGWLHCILGCWKGFTER